VQLTAKACRHPHTACALSSSCECRQLTQAVRPGRHQHHVYARGPATPRVLHVHINHSQHRIDMNETKTSTKEEARQPTWSQSEQTMLASHLGLERCGHKTRVRPGRLSARFHRRSRTYARVFSSEGRWCYWPMPMNLSWGCPDH